MNNSGYLISLTILNIMKSHTIIPHPSPWILATDRSPVGNGNVTLIHLFTNKSLPNNFQYTAKHPKTFLWKQARTDIHCKLVFTTVLAQTISGSFATYSIFSNVSSIPGKRWIIRLLLICKSEMTVERWNLLLHSSMTTTEMTFLQCQKSYPCWSVPLIWGGEEYRLLCAKGKTFSLLGQLSIKSDLPREAVHPPSLEIFQAKLLEALCNLVWLL